METLTSNAVDIDANKVKEGNEKDDALTGLQELRMKEAHAICPRCRQGFCADHGTRLGAYKQLPLWAAMTQLPDEEGGKKPQEEELGFDTDEETEVQEEVGPQECKNEGCGKKFTEKENHSFACHYHRGPVSYSNRSTDKHKWICCEVSVPSFEELAAVPPCTHGKHYAPPKRNQKHQNSGTQGLKSRRSTP